MTIRKRPGVHIAIINRSPNTETANAETGGGGGEGAILTAEISGGVFYLKQIPSDGEFKAEIIDSVFYLTQPHDGNYKAEIVDDIFYLTEVKS